MRLSDSIGQRGRTPVDRKLTRSRVDRPTLKAIDDWIADDPAEELSRFDVVRIALTKWSAIRNQSNPRSAHDALPVIDR